MQWHIGSRKRCSIFPSFRFAATVLLPMRAIVRLHAL